jgi:hypothetical protein
VVSGPLESATIGPASGVLTTNRFFDFEDPTDRSITIGVQAVERGVSDNSVTVALRSNLCNVTFAVADVNDNAPQFDAAQYVSHLVGLL